jgi:hypothetical protein
MENFYIYLFGVALLNDLIVGVLIYRLGILPGYQAFVPYVKIYNLAVVHSEKVDASLNPVVKTIIAFLVPFYTAYMAAEIKKKQGANFLRTLIGFWMPVPFGWLAW